MARQPVDETLAELLRTMNKGQFLLFARALAAAGGEVRLSVQDIEAAATVPSPRVTVDATDGAVIVRIVGA